MSLVINKQHCRIQQTSCGGSLRMTVKGTWPWLMADLRSNGGRSPVVAFTVFQLCCLSMPFANEAQERRESIQSTYRVK